MMFRTIGVYMYAAVLLCGCAKGTIGEPPAVILVGSVVVARSGEALGGVSVEASMVSFVGVDDFVFKGIYSFAESVVDGGFTLNIGANVKRAKVTFKKQGYHPEERWFPDDLDSGGWMRVALEREG